MSDSDGYALHARLIGAVPEREQDLFVSIAMGFVFWAFAVGAGFRWRTPRGPPENRIYPYKSDILIALAVSCFFLGLAYWIRAGLAGSDLQDQKKSTYVVEQFCFIVASLLWVDLPAMTITRDEIMFDMIQESFKAAGKDMERPLRPLKHWIQKTILACRVLWIVAGVLEIMGYVQLPDPANTTPSSKSTNLRLAGSLIVFLLLLFTIMMLAYACLSITLPGLLMTRLLVLWLILCVLIPSLYNFLIVAVTDDRIDIIKSKVFFYFAYAFFPALMVATCIALELNVYTGSAEFKWFII